MHIRYHVDNPTALKPRAASLVESWVLTLPMLAVYDYRNSGFVRRTYTGWKYEIDSGSHLPWIDFFVIRKLVDGTAHFPSILCKKLNYKSGVSEEYYRHRYDKSLPTIGEGEILYLFSLSTKECHEQLDEALAD